MSNLQPSIGESTGDIKDSGDDVNESSSTTGDGGEEDTNSTSDEESKDSIEVMDDDDDGGVGEVISAGEEKRLTFSGILRLFPSETLTSLVK